MDPFLREEFESLSDRDQTEVRQFLRFMDDRKNMDRKELFRKYQHYLGLTDEELVRIEGSQ